jgi:hypothetical protein
VPAINGIDSLTAFSSEIGSKRQQWERTQQKKAGETAGFSERPGAAGADQYFAITGPPKR